jgi:hypothetical protein
MNVTITHTAFADGMRNGTMSCFLAEPYQLLKGPRWVMFTFFALLYQVAPVVVVPLWAYHVGTWWLLFGIAFSYLGSALAEQYSRSIFLFGCYCLGFWIRNGFNSHDYTTFCFLCASSGYMLWHLADTVRTSCARQSLISSPTVFNAAVAQDRLTIVQLDSSQPGERHSAVMRDQLQLKPFVPLLVLSNIVAEAFRYVFGLFTGLIGTAIAYAKGIDNLTPNTADSIMRQATKGTLGITVLALGYFGLYSIYGLIFAIAWALAILWHFSKAKKS